MTPVRIQPPIGRAAGAGGFTLVEMALVLLIVGLLAAVFLPATNTLLDNNRRKETRAKLEALEQAMVRFVMVNRRLPCPADGDLATGNANQGLELAAGGACTVLALTNGVVPWRSLGVAQSDALDAWSSMISYRVWGGAGVAGSSLTLADGMNMQALDPASAGVVNAWLAPRGFRVCNAVACAVASPAELASKANGNGAAYVLISHGANRFGGFSADGNYLGTSSGPAPGPLENINRNTLALRSGTPNDFYIDAEFAENPAAYYDDIVLRPTIMAVALAAGLGPRRP